MLFSSYTRTNLDHKRRKETAFEFLDRSAWKISELVRQIVNEFATHYLLDEEFIKMFKSKLDKQHYSAVFELLIHALLTRSNLSLSRHPETKTGKKPDFQVVQGSFKIFVECTLAGHSFDSMTEKNRKDAVEQIVDDMEYFPYWINLGFLTISGQSVSKKRFINFINTVKDLSEGIPNEVLIKMKHLFEDDGWKIEVSLLRKIGPVIKRSLGFISGNAKTIDTSKPILTALNDKKGSRYGIETEPYIVFLNTSDLFTEESCFSEALFGQHGTNKIDLRYPSKNSFYLADGKPINTSVSAVVIFRNFDLYTLDSSSMVIWHNPFAKNKLPSNLLPFDEYLYNITNDFLEQIIIKKEKDIFQLLGIDKEKYISAKDKSVSK
jgi:hypothetical protein